LLDGAALVALALGVLVVARAAWPRLESALATITLPAALSPTLALACLVAVVFPLGALFAARARIPWSSLWDR
jgi:hypothetical protein